MDRSMFLLISCKHFLKAPRFALSSLASESSSLVELDAFITFDLSAKNALTLIDALEFIADCAETKFELLQYLYDMAAEYQNVYIVTSCRTSDKNAFIKLETNFSIKIYEVGDITEDELEIGRAHV